MNANEDGFNLHILAVDDEYLIALDIQYILAPHHWCVVDVEVTGNLAAALSAAKPFDAVIADLTSLRLKKDEIANRVLRTGAALVWATLESTEADLVTEVDGVPCLIKPYSEHGIKRALVEALSEVQPEKARAVAALFVGSGP